MLTLDFPEKANFDGNLPLSSNEASEAKFFWNLNQELEPHVLPFLPS